MKPLNYLYSTLLFFLLVTIGACSNDDNQVQDKEVPLPIKNDFLEKYPVAQIKSFHSYSNGIQQIDFIDHEKNEASIWYVNDSWKMTSTEISDIGQLPMKVKKAFSDSEFGDAQVIDICKTEREEIEQPLYMLHFQYKWKDVEKVEHYVFINGDGMFLTTLTWTPNSQRWFVGLPKDHFDFIAKKYAGAQIRGYINNAGEHEYFIFHQNIIKYVFFRGENTTDYGFWKETRYELDKSVQIPQNVLNVLNRLHPDFSYTNVYYIESDQGNAYWFVDKNDKNELGYCIGANT